MQNAKLRRRRSPEPPTFSLGCRASLHRSYRFIVPIVDLAWTASLTGFRFLTLIQRSCPVYTIPYEKQNFSSIDRPGDVLHVLRVW
jgi:hypothetical protein